MIKEVIVVEGRDDVTAVKRAIEAEVISVGGFGINKQVIDRIKAAQQRQGVIVFTDPDFAGEKIRRIISKRVPGIKHAYIVKEEGLKDGNIGVENASPETILKALERAKCEMTKKRKEFTVNDMIEFRLSGYKDSKIRREKVGQKLGIGYSNGAQFLSRLNSFGITREELSKILNLLEEERG